MWRRIIHGIIGRQEKKLGVSLEYLREISEGSPGAFLKFGLFAPLANHRRKLPKEAWHLARLAATQAEDCGTCVQIVVNLAKADGVAPGLIQTALAGALDELPLDLALVMQFSECIARGEDREHLRNRLVAIYGEAAFHEVALAIATARVFPTIKRALGHAQSCEVAFPEVRRRESARVQVAEFAC
jgi:hypothetical protein